MTGATLTQVHGSSPAEYQYAEIWNYECSDIAEWDGSWEVCPEEEVPVIHARDGAQVVRCLVYDPPQQGMLDEMMHRNPEDIENRPALYMYELMWPDGRLVTADSPDVATADRHPDYRDLAKEMIDVIAEDADARDAQQTAEPQVSGNLLDDPETAEAIQVTEHTKAYVSLIGALAGMRYDLQALRHDTSLIGKANAYGDAINLLDAVLADGDTE